jgi:3-oxosteroid 1-dehydrogenase
MDPGDRKQDPRLSRRAFLRRLGIGTGAAAMGSALPLQAATDSGLAEADLDVDVAVVGTSGAGFSAALCAQQSGADAAIFEKSAFAGGTTVKSGGVYWVPNNPVMQAAGLADPREHALRYMARLSYPDLYSPARPRLGLRPNAYALLATFYDRGAEILAGLHESGVLDYAFWPGADGRPFPDYHAEIEEDRSPRGAASSLGGPTGCPASEPT